MKTMYFPVHIWLKPLFPGNPVVLLFLVACSPADSFQPVCSQAVQPCTQEKVNSMGKILPSTNDSIQRIPRPQMRADTQALRGTSLVLLPGLGPTGFEHKPTAEDREVRGLHWMVCWLLHRRVLEHGCAVWPGGCGAWEKEQSSSCFQMPCLCSRWNNSLSIY